MSDHDPESTLPEQEKLVDVSDRATQLEMEATADALRAVQRASRRQQEPDAEGRYLITECIECGDEIGEERLRVAIKNKQCIHCTALQERRR